MQKRKVIALDQDDVMNSLVSEAWLDFYNWDSNDNLTAEQIVDWDIAQFVKPGFEKRIYEYLSDRQIARTIFHNTKPQKNSVEVTKWLQQDFDVYVVTATHPNNAHVKWEWMERYFPHIPLKNFVVLADKFLFKADYLVDDKPSTIKSFTGKGIIYSQPWNRSLAFPRRVNNWNDIKSYFEQELRNIEVMAV